MLRLILLLLGVIPVAVAGQERIGQTRQAIVGGSPITPMMREEYGLLSVSDAAGGSCSATLLTNEWLITAAHCLDPADVADPRRISVVASWQTEQVRQGLEVRNFGPTPDIALIRTSAFRRFGTTTGYSRPLLANGLDDLRHWPITTYGRGIHVLATGSGPTATPSQSDGEYRHATTRIDRVEGSLYWFPANENYQIIAGGDSGGPSFVRSQRGMELAGVHSDCRIYCLPGKVCKDDWQWVMGIPECADAPVALVASEIRKIISERRIDVTQDLSEARRTGGPRVSSVGRLDPNTPLFKPGPIPAGSVPAYVYAVRKDGMLEWRRHDGAGNGGDLWQGPAVVGSHWAAFRQVFSGGGNVVYALSGDGRLLWYRHNGAYGNGELAAWSGPKEVASGWGGYTHVFSAGEGVLYGVTPDGRLMWQRHLGYREGTSEFTRRSHEMGAGWGNYTHVVPAGDGIIYARDGSGALWWFKHDAFREGLPSSQPGAWQGPRQVAGGWPAYRAMFSTGNGVIYCLDDSGTLVWRRHRSWQTGTPPGIGRVWAIVKEVGRGWSDVQAAFALLPGPADVIR